jgi:hypothetical protein
MSCSRRWSHWCRPDSGLFGNEHPRQVQDSVRGREQVAWTQQQTRPRSHLCFPDLLRKGVTMSIDSQSTAPARPGGRQGPTSELTTFFRVKRGHEQQLRAILEASGRRSDEERKALGLAVGTLHEMRWVLFDNDTRLMFCTSYDGEWDPYIEDFVRVAQPIFDTIFVHVEGYPEGGIRDPRAKDYVVQQQVTALDYTRLYDATAKQVRKALAVAEAFQEVLDTPEFGRALEDPALKPLLETPAFQALLHLAAD